MCTLNQFVIGLNGQELAKKLVEIYFTFFKVGSFFAKTLIDFKFVGMYSEERT